MDYRVNMSLGGVLQIVAACKVRGISLLPTLCAYATMACFFVLVLKNVNYLPNLFLAKMKLNKNVVQNAYIANAYDLFGYIICTI